jgi:hypothetical protein
LYPVEECVRGRTLSEIAVGEWADLSAADREARVRALAGEFVRFWRGLRKAGWFYCDVSAGNVMIEGATLRVVDAGSAVPARRLVVPAGYTPAFTTPVLLRALSAGRAVSGTEATILPMLAKVLHFALTLDEPLDGAYPNLDAICMVGCSSACKDALRAMLSLDAHPRSYCAACQRLFRWAALA